MRKKNFLAPGVTLANVMMQSTKKKKKSFYFFFLVKRISPGYNTTTEREPHQACVYIHTDYV